MNLFLAIAPGPERIPKSYLERLTQVEKLVAAWSSSPGLQANLQVDPKSVVLSVEGHSVDSLTWGFAPPRIENTRSFLRPAPLFYYQSPNLWACSRSLKALACFLGELTLDRAAALDYFRYGLLQDPESTIFQEIKRQALNTQLSWNQSSLSTKPNWLPHSSPPSFHFSGSHLWEFFHQKLRRATHDALGLSKKPAIALSGGVDSALLVPHLTERWPQAVAYTSVRPGQDSEDRWSRATAEHHQIPHHLVCEPYGELFEADTIKFLKTAPEPLCNPHFARTHRFYSQISRAGHDTVLLGEDGDALLARDALIDLGSRSLYPPLALGAFFAWFRHKKRPSIGLKRWWKGTREKPTPSHNPFLLLSGPFRELETGQIPQHPWRPTSVERLTRISCIGQFFDSLTPDWTGLNLKFHLPLYHPEIMDFLLALPTWPWALDKLFFREYLYHYLKRERDFSHRSKTPLPIDPITARPLASCENLLQELDSSPELGALLNLSQVQGGLVSWEQLSKQTKTQLAIAMSFALWYKGSRDYIEKLTL